MSHDTAHDAIYSVAFLAAAQSSYEALEGLVGALAAVAIAAHKGGSPEELDEWLCSELKHALAEYRAEREASESQDEPEGSTGGMSN